MVRDLFPVRDIPKVSSLLMLVGLTHVAPTFGGYVTDYFGWHAVFLILMFIGIVVLLASHLVLPNTAIPSAKTQTYTIQFWNVLKELSFIPMHFYHWPRFSGLLTWLPPLFYL
jgi:DHA1 family bicyclomycin/chloramphenicol resistance-like MFS transporter